MATILVKSFGCSANISEGEMMKGLLQEAKHTVIERESDADTIVLNICTVKGDKHALREIRDIQERYPEKKIVIAGCITPSIVGPIRELVPDASLVSTHNIDKITATIDRDDHPHDFLHRVRLEKVGMPRVRKNPVVGIVNIASGCTSACTFCSTKLVKGGLQSYSKEAILDECQQHISEGCKELWLTSQDNGAWGMEQKQDLADLLHFLTERLRGPYMIRSGMANPKHIVRFPEKLVDAYKHPKVFKFLHIPVQSGSDRVLEAMRRQHTKTDFLRLVKLFREAFPQFTISTDIIVGFPGESEEDFEQTLQLIEEVKPDAVNISRFAARPGTTAILMPDQVHGNVSNERSRALAKLCKKVAVEQNRKWIGWEGEAMVDEQGKNNSWIARNQAYKQIILNGDFQLGQMVRVRITDATHWDLRGEVVE